MISGKHITIATSSSLAFDQRLHRVIKTFLSNGNALTCISRRKNNELNETIPVISEQHELFKQKLVSTFFQKSWLFYAEYNFRLFFQLIFTKTDIIYAVDSDTLLASVICRKITSRKLIYDAHEYFEESPEITDKKLIQKIWHYITQFGVNHSDLCISIGDYLSNVLTKQFGKKFHTIRNLPDRDVESNTSMAKQKIIWYQGVLNVGRGLEQMIECMTTLNEYKLLIAGDGDISLDLKTKVKDLNLEDRIIFLGRLNMSELIKHNQKAYIGINLLSSESMNYYYSLANRTFDYIYATLPAIHMNFPEYTTLMQSYEVGVLIESLNTKEIIDAVRKLEEPRFYKHCQEECQKAALENSWKIESVKLIELTNSIC